MLTRLFIILPVIPDFFFSYTFLTPLDQEISFMRRTLMFQTAGLFFFSLLLFLTIPFLSEKSFSDFTGNLFRQELSGNTLNLHYTLADPAAFGITTDQISFGPFPAEPDQEKPAALQQLKEELESFSSLTEEEQHTKTLLSWWLDGQIALNDFYYFQEPLGPTLGIQAQLPILLSEYVFRSEQDVHDYLALLSQFPDYFSALTAFEQKKAEAGLCMNAESLEKVISQCQNFPSDAKNHFLTASFEERLAGCSFLTSNQKISYEIQQQKLLADAVFPAYEQLASDLGDLRGYCPEEPLGLAHVPNGTSYFRWLLTYETGTNRTVAEIQDLLDDQIASDYETILQAVQNGVDLLHPVSETLLPDTEPEQMLLYLSEEIQKDFPTVLDITWQIKNVPDALASTLSPAFFLTPPLDIPQENTIYINPSYEPDEKELLTTLAHEGYPGHLYQNTFEALLDPIRSLLYIGGYTEGWGLYSELYAYDFLGYETETASALRALSSLNYAICSVLDLKVHMDGWKEEDCAEYLKAFGISKAEQIHALYLTLLEEPANYLKYYLGYLEICKLKESAFALSPDLSLMEFHRWFLEYGPAPFFMLQENLESELLKVSSQLLQCPRQNIQFLALEPIHDHLHHPPVELCMLLVS